MGVVVDWMDPGVYGGIKWEYRTPKKTGGPR